MWGIWRSIRRTLPKPAYSLNSFIYIKFLSQETQCTLLSLCLGVLFLLQLRHLHQLPLTKKLRTLCFLRVSVFYPFLNYITYINFLSQKNFMHSVFSVPWCFIPSSTTSSTSTSSHKKTPCTLSPLCLFVLCWTPNVQYHNLLTSKAETKSFHFSRFTFHFSRLTLLHNL